MDNRDAFECKFQQAFQLRASFSRTIRLCPAPIRKS